METSKPPTLQGIKEKSTYSRADSRVNLFQLLGEEGEKVTSVSSGTKCFERYERFNRHGLSLRMCVESLLKMEDWYSTECVLTWKAMDMNFNRFVFQLVPSMLHTDEIGFGLLPTIGANESKGSSRKRYKGSKYFKGAKMSEGLRLSMNDPIYTHPHFAEVAMGFPKDWTLVETQ